MATNEMLTASDNADDLPEPTPLVVDTHGLAALLALPYSTLTKLCAAKAWQYDELPTPVYIGARSRHGNGEGQRRWVIAHVQRWLDERAEGAA